MSHASGSGANETFGFVLSTSGAFWLTKGQLDAINERREKRGKHPFMKSYFSESKDGFNDLDASSPRCDPDLIEVVRRTERSGNLEVRCALKKHRHLMVVEGGEGFDERVVFRPPQAISSSERSTAPMSSCTNSFVRQMCSFRSVRTNHIISTD